MSKKLEPFKKKSITFRQYMYVTNSDLMRAESTHGEVSRADNLSILTVKYEY